MRILETTEKCKNIGLTPFAFPKALATYELIVKLKQSGKKIYAIDEEGNKEELEIR